MAAHDDVVCRKYFTGHSGVVTTLKFHGLHPYSGSGDGRRTEPVFRRLRVILVESPA